MRDTAPRTRRPPMPEPPATPPTPVPAAGRVGRYVLGRALGEGGMGVVYEAHDPELDRPVAIKLVRAGLAGTDPRRFVREARTAARVTHPNVVAVYDVGVHDGAAFLAMELIDGRNAGEVVARKGPLPWASATKLVSAACKGVAAIHAAGLVHRDLKPGNLMVDRSGRVRVTDFGLAKPVDPAVTALTGADRIVGTPDYMSPEQCRGEPPDPRSDVYALGATYFALLTNRPPYAVGEPLQVLFAHCTLPPPDPRSIVPGVPEGCAAVVAKAMAKDPGERYQTAGEMRAALDAVLAAGGDAVTDPDQPNRSLPGTEVMLERTVPLPRPKFWTGRRVTTAVGVSAVAAVVGVALLGNGSRPVPTSATSPVPSASGSAPSPKPDPAPPTGPVLRENDGVGRSVPGPVGSVAATTDGRWLAVGLADPSSGHGGVVLFDRTATGNGAVWRKWPTAGVRGLSFSPDDTLLIGTDSGTARVFLWDVANDRAVEPWDGMGHRDGGYRAATFSPDGRYLAVSHHKWDGSKAVVRLWNAATREKWIDLPSRFAEVRALSFSADGRFLASAASGKDAGVEVWALPAGGASVAVPADPGELGAGAAFARSAPVLAVSDRRRLRAFAAPFNGDPATTVPLPGDPAGVAISPDGRQIAAKAGGAVTVWDARTGAAVTSFPGTYGAEFAIAFAGNGTVVVGDEKKTVWEWPLPAAR